MKTHTFRLYKIKSRLGRTHSHNCHGGLWSRPASFGREPGEPSCKYKVSRKPTSQRFPQTHTHANRHSHLAFAKTCLLQFNLTIGAHKSQPKPPANHPTALSHRSESQRTHTETLGPTKARKAEKWTIKCQLFDWFCTLSQEEC